MIFRFGTLIDVIIFFPFDLILGRKYRLLKILRIIYLNQIFRKQKQIEYNLSINYFHKPALKFTFIFFLTFAITLIFLLVTVNLFTCLLHIVIDKSIFDVVNNYTQNLFFIVITFSTVGYGMDLITAQPNRPFSFDMLILFIQLFGMIFYGWIIGYTLCNLQRITILERWS